MDTLMLYESSQRINWLCLNENYKGLRRDRSGALARGVYCCEVRAGNMTNQLKIFVP